jgi:hypothetical protein
LLEWRRAVRALDFRQRAQQRIESFPNAHFHNASKRPEKQKQKNKTKQNKSARNNKSNEFKTRGTRVSKHSFHSSEAEPPAATIFSLAFAENPAARTATRARNAPPDKTLQFGRESA